MIFSSEDIKREVIRSNLANWYVSFTGEGYNAVHQIAGYLISNDPAYISSHKGARSIIQQIDRDEIIEELVKSSMEERHEYNHGFGLRFKNGGLALRICWA